MNIPEGWEITFYKGPQQTQAYKHVVLNDCRYEYEITLHLDPREPKGKIPEYALEYPSFKHEVTIERKVHNNGTQRAVVYYEGEQPVVKTIRVHTKNFHNQPHAYTFFDGPEAPTLDEYYSTVSPENHFMPYTSFQEMINNIEKVDQQVLNAIYSCLLLKSKQSLVAGRRYQIQHFNGLMTQSYGNQRILSKKLKTLR